MSVENSATVALRIKSLNQDITQAISALRDRIADLKNQRHDVDSNYVDRDTAMQRVDAYLNVVVSRARNAAPSVRQFVHNEKHWHVPSFDQDAAVILSLESSIRKNLQDQIDLFYQSENGIEDFERAQMLADIDRKILDVELAEEAIIRSAEKAGAIINRRWDADVRAVLASDRVLP